MILGEFQNYLDEYLRFDTSINLSKTDPHMTNGLMVRGKDEIKKIGFGVSASIALFEKAQQMGCDALIVHHSFNLPSSNRYDQFFQNRITYLLEHDMSLFGYHFLLDAHPEVGNNAQILKTIGAKPVEPFLFHGDPWGWIGEYDQKYLWQELKSTIMPHLSPISTEYAFGKKQIKRVVAVSGMGAPYPSMMQDLMDSHIDAYITGEVHEWNREFFREARMHFLAGGHYHTEIFGIKALMSKVKEKFPELEVSFVDLENTI